MRRPCLGRPSRTRGATTAQRSESSRASEAELEAGASARAADRRTFSVDRAEDHQLSPQRSVEGDLLCEVEGEPDPRPEPRVRSRQPQIAAATELDPGIR